MTRKGKVQVRLCPDCFQTIEANGVKIKHVGCGLRPKDAEGKPIPATADFKNVDT